MFARPRYAVALIAAAGLFVSGRCQLFDVQKVTLGAGQSLTATIKLGPAGEVVGTLHDSASSSYRGFVWSGGVPVLLSGLGVNCGAGGISPLGVLAGSSDTPASSTGHAVRWDSAASQPVDLGALGQASNGSGARDINSQGWIAGWSYANSFLGLYQDVHPFIFRNGVMTDLGVLGIAPFDAGRGQADSINASGDVVGSYVTEGESYDSRAFIWSEGSGMQALLNEYSLAKDINIHRQVIGVAPSTGAFVWEDGVVNWLQAPEAVAINDAGEIIGIDHGASIAYIWRNSIRYGLDSLLVQGQPWHIMHVFDINNMGQVLAYGQNGTEEAYLVLNPVPEPSSLAMLILVLPMICSARRQRA